MRQKFLSVILHFIIYCSLPFSISQLSPRLKSWQEVLEDKQSFTNVGGPIVETSEESKGAAPTQSPPSCSLTPEEKAELSSYKEVVDKILEASINGKFSGRTYQEIGKFADKFGSRISGSAALEKSIDYMLEEMAKSKLENIHSEPVQVPNWERGDEIAKLVRPRRKSLAISTLGFSVGTPPEGINATAIVVQSFEELLQRHQEVKGKIVIFGSRRRSAFAHSLIGGAVAGQFGAVAALTRTSAPFSLNTPHASMLLYDSKIPQIPVATLSPEDGDLLTRLAAAGEPIEIYLRIEILASNTTTSRNIIGDYIGSEKPNEYVVVSGHIDSWDVGQGALDDGIGVILTSGVVNLLRSLNLQPKRTIRTIYWTAEEMGLIGGWQFVKEHRASMNQYVAALEADFGCLQAMGYIFSGDTKIGCVLREVMSLMRPRANMTQLIQIDFMPTDISGFTASGIPAIVLHGDNGKYFYYHHTEADVLTAMDPKQLDICLGVWTATSYILADMKENLPKHLPQVKKEEKNYF